uniref:Root cap protein 1 n=1 Tax=Oryza brachyantha TaxID=4533 RepID=J3L889_ORYBR
MALVQVVAVALALSCCGAVIAASAATPPPTRLVAPRPKPGTRGKVPRGTPLTTITFSPRHKRDYQVTCTNTGRRPCVVTCPSTCPNKCLVACSYCLTFCMCDLFPGTSCGDPRFTGADGNTFYFHGKKEQDFCIVTDADLHINAHFIGNRNSAMKRDFTWIQALGISFGDHRLYIGARKAAEWDDEEDHVQITFDGEPVNVDAARGAQWVPGALPALSVSRTDTVNAVTVELAGVFTITANAVPITDEDSRIHHYGKTGKDSLVHLDLGYKFHALTDAVDGVLGQTYRPTYANRLNITAKMPIMGGADKYRSSGLFSPDCAVSRFHRRTSAAAAAAGDHVAVGFAS